MGAALETALPPAGPDDGAHAQSPAADLPPAELPRRGPGRPKGSRNKVAPVDPDGRAALALEAARRRRVERVRRKRRRDEEAELLASAPDDENDDARDDGGATDELDAAGAPEGSTVARPRWPNPLEVEKRRGIAYAVWQQATLPLAGTPWELRRQVIEYDAPPPLGSPPDAPPVHRRLELDPIGVLADGTAAVLAKYLPAVESTPEGAFLAALVLVFGPPTLKTLGPVAGRRLMRSVERMFRGPDASAP